MALADQSFVYSAHSARVLFGRGSFERLGEEVERLGARRALVLCTPNQRAQAEAASDLLGARSAGIFAGAEMHVPLEAALRAREHADRVEADCVVAVGGGSAIGLGKAIALESTLVLVAVPTTYAGSEMTPIYGITAAGHKTTGRSLKVLPRTVVYDPELTAGLSVAASVSSGINAIAHAAEGLYARDGNPVMSLMAEEGIRSLANGLPAVARSPQDLDARYACLYGAWLCGTVLGHVGMALHHKLCHTLGGTFNLPHAETHAVVLPHALAYNRAAAPEAMARIARALGAADAADGIFSLTERLGTPRGLRDIGMAQDDLERACDVALSNPYWNPRPIERSAVMDLLSDAWAGDRPRVLSA